MIEPSCHLKDNSPSSQSLLNDVGQYVSFNHQSTAANSSDSRVKFQLRRWMSILTAFNASPGSCAVISAWCDSRVADDSIKLFLFITDIVAESRDNSFISRRT